MKIDILTLFPGMFESVLSSSMLKKGQDKKLVRMTVRNLRDWTYDRHKTADDTPYGGGPGMVMKVEPLYYALKSVLGKDPRARRSKSSVSTKTKRRRSVRVILLTPQGAKFDQGLAMELSKARHLVLICGHYEGVDERVRNFVTDEISIGDYILTCGEMPAMVLIDAVTRLIPGVLGDRRSLKAESFVNDLLEYPQYTKPREFKGMKVPKILLSGDHRSIEKWRFEEALKRTRGKRPDLLKL